MTLPVETPEPVERVHELNRLFLQSLKSSDAEALVTVGFPLDALPALRSARPEQIEAAADFPRALFALHVERPAGGARIGVIEDKFAEPGDILRLTIVYCAWSTSRESTYHARLFFGLDTGVIHALRTTPLSDLPRFALTRARVRCAFSDAARLWQELLLETRPEARRQLMLVALQPPLNASAAFAGASMLR